MKKILLMILFGSAINMLAMDMAAAEDNQSHSVYGWEMMTAQERQEHRNKMQSFKTEKEREAYRLEHHKHMDALAKERGIDLKGGPSEMMRRHAPAAGPGADGGHNPGMGRGK